MKNTYLKTTQTSGFYGGQPVSYTRRRRKNSVLGSCLSILFLLLIACCAAMALALLWRTLTDNTILSQPSSSFSIKYDAVQPPVESSAENNWALMLVNRDHPLPDGYTFETTTLHNGEQIDSRIYPSLQKMFDDMRAEGIYPMVVSGFRTAERQGEIMQQKIGAYLAEGYSETDARALAESWVASPGTSEHQTGLAVDINGDGTNSTNEEVYAWLLEHAHEYGFIKRYPEGKSEITGIINEPWHYRYVGLSDAAQIKQSGLCLEEYLSQAS